MNLDEWELLPVDGFLDFGEDCSETNKKKKFEPITVIDMDLEYFRCPSPNPRFSPVPVRIQLDPPIKNHESPMEIAKPPPEIEQETVSQVFFKKLDTEFVDMKILDASPRSAAARAVSPPIESFPVFEDEVSDDQGGSGGSPRNSESETAEDGGISLNNILKWSFTGIGAVCSFGAVAATVCIVIIGNRHWNKKQNQKLTFQIYTDDKRIKKVVQRAAKLNEAISAMSGGGSGTHVSYGGYYDGL